MDPDLHCLKQLLGRLRELEQRTTQPEPQQTSSFESAGPSVRDELTELLHTLHDGSYWRRTAALDQRHAS